jgi:xanthine dehydrogenase accessory factor
MTTLNPPSTIDHSFSQLADSNSNRVLATVIQAVSPTSGKPGDKALVDINGIIEGWIGGGCAQPAVIEAAEKALISGKPSIIRVGPKGEWQTLDGVVDFASGCLSGGTLVIFIEPLLRAPKLFILGNSPVAMSLHEQATLLDFSVVIASPELNIDELSAKISAQADFSNLDADFIVIATQGRNDRSALNAALASNAGYISMVSSAKKLSGLKSILARDGSNDEQLDRIKGPAGIDIGAETPAEIALSVLADIVRARRAGTVRHNSLKPLEQKADSDVSPSNNDGGSCCGS